MKKFLRYRYQGAVSYGLLSPDEQFVQPVSGLPYEDYRASGTQLDIADVEILVPCEPSKVLAVGWNYFDHLRTARGNEQKKNPEGPDIFSKFPSSLIANGQHIVLRDNMTKVQMEAEFVAVIGRTACKVSVKKAPEYIFGLTLGNDISERNWQHNDAQWWRAKGSDTFAPVGPYIVTDLDFSDLSIKAYINGELEQKENTRAMAYNIAEIISFISRYVTLWPGDLVFTGTPARINGGEPTDLKAGDVCKVSCTGLGKLMNTVVTQSQV